ncbi:MAG: cytochrome c [Nitrospiraceae bacterium]|nr:cytochrome c [Nitrospiraceae bacterium]
MNRNYLIFACMLLAISLLSACAQETRRPAGPPAKAEPLKIVVKTDSNSIEAGKLLFTRKCEYCHNAHTTATFVGPGLKGILKNPTLPISKKPATPENIVAQLRHPMTNMPSFVFLTDDDILNLLAFLNTL